MQPKAIVGAMGVSRPAGNGRDNQGEGNELRKNPKMSCRACITHNGELCIVGNA